MTNAATVQFKVGARTLAQSPGLRFPSSHTPTRARVVPDMPRSSKIIDPLPDVGEVSPTAQLALQFKDNLGRCDGGATCALGPRTTVVVLHDVSFRHRLLGVFYALMWTLPPQKLHQGAYLRVGGVARLCDSILCLIRRMGDDIDDCPQRLAL